MCYIMCYMLCTMLYTVLYKILLLELWILASKAMTVIPKLLRSIIGIHELINTYYRPSNNR